MSTKFITDTLGPLGIDWKFNEVARDRELRTGRIRVCLEVKVRKSLVFDDTKSTGFSSVSVWGTADSLDAANNEAIENALMWLQLHPTRAKAKGLQSCLDVLGPVGGTWDFEVLSSKTAVTHGGSTTNKVKVSIKKSALTGTDAKDSVSHTETCQIAHRANATLHPDEEATIQAVKKCMSWFCIFEDEDLKEEPTSESLLEEIKPQTEPKKSRFRSIGLASACLIVGFAFFFVL